MIRARRTPLLWLAIAALGFGCQPASDPLEEIRGMHREGRYAASLTPLRRLIDRDPSQLEAHLLLGSALLRSGQAGLAIWPLSRAREVPEYSVEAGMLLTRAMLESRSAPDAIAAIDRVLELEPENLGALILRAEAYTATNRFPEARADLERVLELDPENLDALVPRVIALLALEEVEAAELAIEQARSRFASADPEVPEALHARLCIADALFTFEKGDGAAAEIRYTECLEHFPTDPLAVTETAAYYQRTGRVGEATEILQRAYEATRSTYFRVGLAQRMGALGNFEEQERLLREEAEERPSWLAWFNVADLHVQREAWDPAIDAFERAAAETAAPNPKLLFAFADTLVQAGQYDRAREINRQISAPELRHLIRGRILLEEGDPAGSLQAFEEGIRLWPNNAAGRYLAGLAAQQLGNFERASSHFREALRAEPGRTEAGLLLAELYAARGDMNGALDAVGRYVRSHRADPEGYLLTIRIAHDMEHFDLAATGLERLMLLPGQAPRAVAEEARLVALRRGPEGAIQVVEDSELALTDPANAPALRMLLVQLAAAGDHERARREIRSALEAEPQAAIFHELHGQVLRAAGAPAAEARAAFRSAIDLEPDSAGALSGLAELTAEAGELDAAVALFERAAAADPGDPEPTLRAARLLADAGRGPAAQSRLETLLVQHPRSGDAALALAELLEERGELEAATRYARRAAWLRTPASVETLERLREKQAAPQSAAAG